MCGLGGAIQELNYQQRHIGWYPWRECLLEAVPACRHTSNVAMLWHAAWQGTPSTTKDATSAVSGRMLVANETSLKSRHDTATLRRVEINPFSCGLYFEHIHHALSIFWSLGVFLYPIIPYKISYMYSGPQRRYMSISGARGCNRSKA